MKKLILAALLLAGACHLSHAQLLIGRTSTQFSDYLSGRSYEGDVLPQNNTGAPFIRRASGTITTESVAGGYLTFQRPVGATLSYQVGTLSPAGPISPTWWTDNANPAKGFTVEMRFQAIDGYTFNFMASYNNSNPSQVLYITSNTVTWGSTVISTALNSDTFHTFRLVNLPNSSTYQLWRDDILIAPSLAGVLTTAPNRFWFGNWGGTAGGGVLDYLRWDTSGAYQPIPEPSSLAPLTFGLAFCGAWLLRRKTPRNLKV